MRAVDADELIKELDKDGVMEYGAVSVFGVPIIEDCVPVVRCKDCMHKHPYNNVWLCRFGLMMPGDDGYCSYGEKVSE